MLHTITKHKAEGVAQVVGSRRCGTGGGEQRGVVTCGTGGENRAQLVGADRCVVNVQSQ